MAKTTTRYVCGSCGRATPKYMGRCPKCGEFGTMSEEVIVPEATAQTTRRVSAISSEPRRLRDVEADRYERLSLPLSEFSRVLGGGIVPGSLVLLGGDPGIGKSTLLLQVASILANVHGRILYISGEESMHQIKMRADRLSLQADDLFLVTETSIEAMLKHVEAIQPVLIIVDSIQTTVTNDSNSTAGSVSQVRKCAGIFQEVAKGTGVTVFLVGHVTKEGAIAGPRVLEHIVDAVLYLEGDQFHKYRLLRSVKNRFGATNEVGVFEMVANGMVEVPNPSEAFLAERQASAPGSAIAVTMEGTRPLLVEIQALASSTAFANPRRTANGVDYNRMLLIAAVLGKRERIKLFDKDLFVNVIGGLQISEPASDLAIATAIASSTNDRPSHADMAFVGEIGLSGELRAVSQLETRVKEAAKLGFKRCVVPRRQARRITAPEGIELIGCATLADVLAIALVKA
jgi:DNA repair protein RadA/Sms